MSFKNVISFFASQVGGSQTSEPTPEPIGIFINDLLTNINDWTDSSPNATFTPGGSGLSVSGGIGSTWVTDILEHDFANGYENFTITMEFVMTTRGGIAVSAESIQKISTGGGAGLNRSFIGACAYSGGNYYAQLVSFGEGSYSTATQLALSAGSAISDGDSMRIEFNRSDYNLYTLTVYNITKSTSQNVSYRQVYPTYVVPNVIHRPTIHALSGAQLVTLFKDESTSYKNVRALFGGDSITQAYLVNGVTEGSLRYAPRTFDGSSRLFEVNAGGNHNCEQLLASIEACKLINPEYFIMMIGGNDIYSGTAEGTYKPQYTSIRDQMSANGSIIVHLLATPRDATNMTTFNSWISSTFTSDIIVDTFTPLKDGGTGLAASYDQDGTHPNSAGHQLIADTINAAIPTLIV